MMLIPFFENCDFDVRKNIENSLLERLGYLQKNKNFMKNLILQGFASKTDSVSLSGFGALFKQNLIFSL